MWCGDGMVWCGVVRCGGVTLWWSVVWHVVVDLMCSRVIVFLPSVWCSVVGMKLYEYVIMQNVVITIYVWRKWRWCVAIIRGTL